MTVLSLTALKKRRKQFKDLCNRLGLSGRFIQGHTRELLVKAILRFLHKPGECSPGVEDIGDNAVIAFYDEMVCDTDFLQQRKKAVELMLVPFVGTKLDPDKLRELCIVVTGRFELLREAKLISGWGTDEIVETLLYVHEAKRFPARGRRYYVEFEAFTGIPSGSKWKSQLTGGQLQQMIRETGVAKFKKYRDEDIAGLWLIATLQFVDARLTFHEIRFDHSYQKYNRLVMKERQKVCTGPCVYMQGKPCAPCPVSRAQCPISRFDNPFDKEGMCRNGHIGIKQNESDAYCFSCLERGVFHEEHLGPKHR